MKISATILLKGAPKHLSDVLSALMPLDEVLIYDNGAYSEAIETCKRAENARIVEGPFLGFGPTHNKASNLAKNDWILSIDSDEVASPELVAEILSLNYDNCAVYTISRKNRYQGQWIRGSGWWPDRALRLYNKKYTQFSNAYVHESIETAGMRVIPLQNHLNHYSYDSISEFLVKMNSYSDLFASQWAGTKSSSPCKAALHGMFAFFKSYFLKAGFQDGYAGFLISAYNGHTTFYKYMKLYETNLRMRRCPDEKESSCRRSNEAQK